MLTATIHRNFRDIHTTTPKVLLTSLCEDGKELRDHCWVTITNRIEKFIPKKNTQSIDIRFTGKLETYQTIGDEKITVKALRSIEKI
jgi:hypothetical protein